MKKCRVLNGWVPSIKSWITSSSNISSSTRTLRKICIFLADRTGDQASAHSWILWGLFQKEVELSFIHRVVSFPTNLEFCWAHTLSTCRPRTSTWFTVFSVTADCLSVTFMGRHFVSVCMLESNLWIQSGYVPDNTSQKVTGSHSLFLTVNPNPHWPSKKPVCDSQELPVSRNCGCSAPPEIKHTKKRVFKCLTIYQSL